MIDDPRFKNLIDYLNYSFYRFLPNQTVVTHEISTRYYVTKKSNLDIFAAKLNILLTLQRNQQSRIAVVSLFFHSTVDEKGIKLVCANCKTLYVIHIKEIKNCT